MTTLKYSDQIKLYLGEQFNLPGEQVETMLPNFIQTLKSHMENLENSLADNQYTSLGKAVHTIKGALMNLGLFDCAQIAIEIETGCHREDDTLDYPEMVNSLRLLVNDIINE